MDISVHFWESAYSFLIEIGVKFPLKHGVIYKHFNYIPLAMLVMCTSLFSIDFFEDQLPSIMQQHGVIMILDIQSGI